MIYEYKCLDCGHVFERDYPVSLCSAGAQCPECGGDGCRRYSFSNLYKPHSRPGWINPQTGREEVLS